VGGAAGSRAVTPLVDNQIDWASFRATRRALGADFIRILGYFREDGAKSLVAIEAAMRARNPVALVIPAHTLKGESLQFGAETLAALAEEIEMVARHCIEVQEAPDELIERVVRLRPLLEDTLAAFDRECNPLVERRVPGGFGRKTGAGDQGFGPL